MATERLRVILELEASQYKREASSAAAATKQLGDTTTATSKSAEKLGTQTDAAATRTQQLNDRYTKLNTTVGRVQGYLAAAVAVKAVSAVVSDLGRAASDLSESTNAVEVTFGEASGRITAFGEVAAQVSGLSRSEFQSLSTVTGALLKNMGFSLDEAAEQSIRLAARAADMASVFNTDVATAVEAVNSALKGETDPIEQYGVKLNEAAIKAKALELGLVDGNGAITEHGKTIARLELIYEQTSAAQGDFIRTSGEAANAARIAAAEWENAKAGFGEAVLPLAAGAANLATDQILTVRRIFGDEVAGMAQDMRNAIGHINEVTTAGGNSAAALANAMQMVAEKGSLTADQFYALATAAGIGEDQFGVFRDEILRVGAEAGVSQDILDEMTGAIDGAGESALDAEGNIDGLAGAEEEVATAAERAAAAHQELISSMLEALDPAARAAGALQRMNDAEEAAAAAKAEHGANSEEAAQAQLDYALAVLQAQGALNEFSAAGPTSSIQTLANTLQISFDEAAELLNQLGILDGMQVTSTHVLVTDQTIRVHEKRVNDNRTYQGGRAAGGPTYMGQSYRFGEGNAPEVYADSSGVYVMPGENGAMLSNQQVRALVQAIPSGGGGGGDVTVNINNPVSTDITGGASQALQLAQMTRRVARP